MTLSFYDLLLYAGAVAVLFLTPGPVWVAIVARGLSGGFQAAWPLALGVVVGDALWPLLAILGVTWVVSVFEGFMLVMRFIAVGVFLWMGYVLIKNADKEIAQNSALTKPGTWAGFIAGLTVILGNPKAILFYMGMLPGFFDLTSITAPDIAAIVAVSILVPFIGNLGLALSLDKIRDLLRSPSALRRMNISAGILLIFVGLIIPFV
ncbi:LysE family translocator [Cochlodiniinecator piscidefendens]|uniref:LysE family translocator n=1 Tax=Cochlodiniinecator piscidefendens TaxID=2715756 RepID=UPI00140D0CEF|nr:LysE family translocator [Cochlodiniinecator piscidefendens]